MSGERTVIEVQPGRRIIRIYGPDGALVRIRVEPQTAGPTSDLPPITPPARTPENPVVAALARDATPPAALPVELEPYEEPAPAPPVPAAPPPEPAAASPAIQPPPIARFEVVATQRVAPRAEILAPQPEPAPPSTVEPDAAEAAATPAPAPVADPEPAPIDSSPSAELHDDQPVEAAPPEPTTAPPPEPEAPTQPRRPYRDIVPDVDERVDALLRDPAARARRRRKPLKVPSFAPLQREAWEDRLDALLQQSSA